MGGNGILGYLSVSQVIIILVNWNGWKDTIECLESLLLLKYPFFRIVVCDNGSRDESLRELRWWARRTFGVSATTWQELSRADAETGGGLPDTMFTLVENGVNLGFGGGSNVGMRYALACEDVDYCWLLNNDTVVAPLALTKMVERMFEKPDAGMCGSTVRQYLDRSKIDVLGGATYFKWLGVAWHIGRTLRGNMLLPPESVENRMDYVVGSSLLVRTSFLRDVGLMAEEYFLYFEEVDWALRCKGRYSLAYAPESVVYHKVGASIGTATNPRTKSYICDYYTLRNRLVFTQRYYPLIMIGIYASLAGEMVVRLLFGRWDLAKMILKLVVLGVAESDKRVARDGII